MKKTTCSGLLFLIAFLMVSFIPERIYAQCSCTLNMSFEHAAGACDGEQTTPKGQCQPDGWVSDYPNGGTTDIGPGEYGFNQAPADGANFMSFWTNEYVTLPLCANTALTAGTKYCFSLEWYRASSGFNASTIVYIYGGATAGALTQLLWTSPPTSTDATGGKWNTWTFCFTPTSNWTDITFQLLDDPNDAGFGGYVALDNWLSTDGLFPPQPTTGCNPEVTTTDVSICKGICSNLIAVGSSGTAPYTYSWSSGQTGATINVCPTVTTTYTVTLTDAGGKTATSQAVVTVNPLPTVNVNSPSVCGGSPATLTASGATTYSWTPATGLSATTGASVVSNVSTATIYTVTGTTASCSATATSTVSVNPLPVVTANSVSVCPGTQATLTAGGASTYTWNTGATGSSITVNPASTTVYTVTGTDVNTCSATATGTVTINSNPSVTANSNSPVCENQTINFTTSSATTYTWTGPGGFQSSVQNPDIANAGTANSGTYTLTISNGPNCTASTTLNVVVNALPVVMVNSASVCVGTPATLTASGATTYTWSPATGLSATSGESTTANINTSTIYTLTGATAGCTGAATSTITVNPLPLVSVTSVSVCPGITAVITASGANTYVWNTGSTSPSITVTPQSTTVYTATGTDLNVCSSSGTGSVVINSNPTVIVSSNSPVCQYETLNFTASSASTYTWSGPGGFQSFLQNPFIANATPANSGTYTITVANGPSCIATTTLSVLVNPSPTLAVNSNSICIGGSTTLTASGAANYTWSPATGLNSTSSQVVTANPTKTTVYTVTGNSAGCAGIATSTLAVNPLPVISETGSTVCEHATITLKASGGTVYVWSGPDNFSSTQQNPNITNSAANMSGTYSVIVVDANGCVNKGTAQVTINSAPVVTVNTGSICAGNSIVLSANGAYTYYWNPSTGLSTNNTASVMASPTVSTTYTVIGRSLSGCTDTVFTSVKVNPIPNASIGPKSVSGCAPVCVNFTDTVAAKSTCNWTFGDGNTSTSCAINHCFKTQGTYHVALEVGDSNGCKNTGYAQVLVYPIPVADFEGDPQPTDIYNPTIHFTNLSTNATIVSWNWNFSDTGNTISSLQNPSHTYSSVGSYPVQLIVISNHGCTDTTSKVIRIDEDYELYIPSAFSPNNDGRNDIFFPKGEGITDYKLYIFDRWGSQLFYSNDFNIGWDGRYQHKSNEILQEDVYVWKIEATTVNGQDKQLSGIVTLIK
jgi:gliding motility-associated-like protein